MKAVLLHHFLYLLHFRQSYWLWSTGQIYLRRQQERDLMQKARLLTDENSVSFRILLISCLLLHFVQKAKFPCSKKVGAILRSLFLFCLFVRGGGGSMRRSQNLEISEKKLHKALRSVQFLASFTSFYFEILSYLACGEKIIRLASKNSVKLDQKSASDF